MEHEMELEKQVAELNKRMNDFELDLAVIKSNYATKADVLEAKNSTIIWTVSAVFLAQLLPLLLKKLGM
jgi:ABC-type metal ion transport system substrate-binding protein